MIIFRCFREIRDYYAYLDRFCEKNDWIAFCASNRLIISIRKRIHIRFWRRLSVKFHSPRRASSEMSATKLSCCTFATLRARIRCAEFTMLPLAVESFFQYVYTRHARVAQALLLISTMLGSSGCTRICWSKTYNGREVTGAAGDLNRSNRLLMRLFLLLICAQIGTLWMSSFHWCCSKTICSLWHEWTRLARCSFYRTRNGTARPPCSALCQHWHSLVFSSSYSPIHVLIRLWRIGR